MPPIAWGYAPRLQPAGPFGGRTGSNPVPGTSDQLILCASLSATGSAGRLRGGPTACEASTRSDRPRLRMSKNATRRFAKCASKSSSRWRSGCPHLVAVANAKVGGRSTARKHMLAAMTNRHFGRVSEVWKHLILAEVLAAEQPASFWILMPGMPSTVSSRTRSASSVCSASISSLTKSPNSGTRRMRRCCTRCGRRGRFWAFPVVPSSRWQFSSTQPSTCSATSTQLAQATSGGLHRSAGCTRPVYSPPTGWPLFMTSWVATIRRLLWCSSILSITTASGLQACAPWMSPSRPHRRARWSSTGTATTASTKGPGSFISSSSETPHSRCGAAI